MSKQPCLNRTQRAQLRAQKAIEPGDSPLYLQAASVRQSIDRDIRKEIGRELAVLSGPPTSAEIVIRNMMLRFSRNNPYSRCVMALNDGKVSYGLGLVRYVLRRTYENPRKQKDRQRQYIKTVKQPFVKTAQETKVAA